MAHIKSRSVDFGRATILSLAGCLLALAWFPRVFIVVFIQSFNIALSSSLIIPIALFLSISMNHTLIRAAKTLYSQNRVRRPHLSVLLATFIGCMTLPVILGQTALVLAELVAGIAGLRNEIADLSFLGSVGFYLQSILGPFIGYEIAAQYICSLRCICLKNSTHVMAMTLFYFSLAGAPIYLLLISVSRHLSNAIRLWTDATNGGYFQKSTLKFDRRALKFSFWFVWGVFYWVAALKAYGSFLQDGG